MLSPDRKALILNLLAEISGLDAAEIAEQHELVADLGIDSAKALQLLVRLEDDLGVEIADEDAASMNTVGDILASPAWGESS